jgi:hypothetical protein
MEMYYDWDFIEDIEAVLAFGATDYRPFFISFERMGYMY